jgi:hypothetical protein
MTKFRFCMLVLTAGLGAIVPPVSFADGGDSVCFYLDKEKFEGKLIPVRLTADSQPSLELQKRGLLHGDERLCQWSLRGGSGLRETFALDGDFAIPILDRDCESPFGHIYTGVGFGDWYLTLCGSCSGDNLVVSFEDSEYSVPIESLEQWTGYPPEEFPIE